MLLSVLMHFCLKDSEGRKKLDFSVYVSRIRHDIANTFEYLPFSLISSGIIIIMMIVILRLFSKDKNINIFKIFCNYMTVTYLIMVICITLLSRESGSRTGIDLGLFDTWGNRTLPDRYFVENIILFIPYGILMPASIKAFRRGTKCIISAFLFSACLELTQLIAGRGFCQLDDVITNGFGSCIGYIFLKLLIWLSAVLKVKKESINS